MRLRLQVGGWSGFATGLVRRHSTLGVAGHLRGNVGCGRILTNLAKVAHDAGQAFVLEVGLGGGYARSRRFETNMIDILISGCGPVGLVNNPMHFCKRFRVSE